MALRFGPTGASDYAPSVQCSSAIAITIIAAAAAAAAAADAMAFPAQDSGRPQRRRPRGRGTDRWSGTVELAVHLCGEWASTDTTTAATAAASSSSSGVWSCDPNLALPVTSAPFSVFSTTPAASSLPPASLLSLVESGAVAILQAAAVWPSIVVDA